MSPPKRQPTNQDLMNKLESFEVRLRIVEKRWEAVDIAKEAIKEYQKDHPVNEENNSPNAKALAAVIAALALVVTALVALAR